VGRKREIAISSGTTTQQPTRIVLKKRVVEGKPGGNGQLKETKGKSDYSFLHFLTP